jgi:dTMP kinase
MAATRDILPGFIVLEGLDGSGTTTQAKVLVSRLKENGIRAHSTAEPTDGPIGTMVRDALHKRTPLENATLAYLYAADRHEHLWGQRNSITTNLSNGLVVSDRYIFSSLAYQTIHAPEQLVHALNAPFPYPEHLIFIEVTPEMAEERRASRTDPDIFEHLEFQRQVAGRYERVLADLDASDMKIHRIDGSGKQEEVAQRIWENLGIAPINSV